jgi:hypothetical protein
MKKFNVLKFIIRMLKVGAWLTVAFTVVIALIAGGSTLDNFLRWEFWRTTINIINHLVAFGIGITFGMMTALILYSIAELLDLLVSIQENTYSAANVLRNMYRDQLNSQNVAAVHNSTDRTVRLHDVTPEGDVVEAELLQSTSSRLA